MGHAPELVMAPRAPRRGVALATILMIMVVLVAIPAALFAVVSTQSRAELNRNDQRQAELLAQAGAAHVAGLIKNVIPGIGSANLLMGSDLVAGGDNDGLLIGHSGLTGANNIPGTGIDVPGAGRYYVRVIEDEPNAAADVLSGARIGGAVWADGGTHAANYTAAPVENNNRLLVQCLGVTRNGSRAVVNMRLQRDPSPGLTIGGDLEVFARVAINGACADIHANGTIRDTRGSANWGSSANYPVAATWSATGTIPNYFLGTKLQNQAARGMPVVPGFETLCSQGTVTRYQAMSRSDRTQAINLDAIADGATLCVYGNASLTCNTKCRNNPSTPRSISVIATGSIRLLINKDAFLVPAHPDGYQFVAGGDLDLTESGTNAMTLGAQGSSYCGSQLRIDVNLSADGQIICKGDANPLRGPSGPTGPQTLFTGTSGGYQGNYVVTSNVGKASTITFNCSGALANTMVASPWYPSVGS